MGEWSPSYRERVGTSTWTHESRQIAVFGGTPLEGSPDFREAGAHDALGQQVVHGLPPDFVPAD